MTFTIEEERILKLMAADVKAKMLYLKERETPNQILIDLKTNVATAQTLLKEGC